MAIISIYSDSSFIYEETNGASGDLITGNYQFATGKIKKENDSVYFFESHFMFGFYEMMRLYKDTISVFVSEYDSRPVSGINAEITRASGKKITDTTSSKGAIKLFVSNSAYVKSNARVKIIVKENDIDKKQFELSEKSDADFLLDHSVRIINKFRIKENGIEFLNNGFIAVKGKNFGAKGK